MYVSCQVGLHWPRKAGIVDASRSSSGDTLTETIGRALISNKHVRQWQISMVSKIDRLPSNSTIRIGKSIFLKIDFQLRYIYRNFWTFRDRSIQWSSSLQKSSRTIKKISNWLVPWGCFAESHCASTKRKLTWTPSKLFLVGMSI